MPSAASGSVAYCGLYCGACKMFKKGRCKGCTLNEKATWCKIRLCCKEKKYTTCADCSVYEDPMRCKKFNTIVSKLFAMILRSDRAACIAQIRADGLEKHAEILRDRDWVTMKRGRK